ncbi:hypothetical protein MNBD_GAMMA10-1064 [hydrothermal vent metagenome]|uniref:Uncharacterized protein n=1 Tax=hydrothermal vent metagenome TaxID=652676 RepID=A0A3B0XMH5_9ZZZZ
MRVFIDKTGMEINLERIDGDDSFAGILEGSAYMIREHRYVQGCSKNEKEDGCYVFGMEELGDELALGNKYSVLPLQERWVAYLYTNSWEPDGRYFLKLMWYQDAMDPFQKLKSIISETVFRDHAVFLEGYDE